MELQPHSPRTLPGWLAPALLGTILGLAAVIAVMLTRPAAVEAPPPAAVAQPESGATGDQAALPEAHGSLDPNGPPVEVIDLAAARAHLDAGTAVFVDVRSGADYAAGHIPGALSITSAELDATLRALPEGAVVIAYGSSVRPDSAQRGAQIFMELGYPKVIALDGGIEAWVEAGNPISQK